MEIQQKESVARYKVRRHVYDKSINGSCHSINIEKKNEEKKEDESVLHAVFTTAGKQ